ncbi:substrate-binding periplasmic protein [Pseudoduganella ginsengisoli]|uniref:Transporter substrate-binding domain-containing protein n=1 Tax=Pseudoduganella ginsengisoli TaxID=1462440 RepID=A0A6L6PWU1_9BURK|nr:transporter substrate-binding domain-containing protein [Pseudoduganella ginsengisoli]MTW01689.1 transporter substrate-binding domain-containing protein [Pseudoduganella ginsengisoli]
MFLAFLLKWHDTTFIAATFAAMRLFMPSAAMLCTLLTVGPGVRAQEAAPLLIGSTTVDRASRAMAIEVVEEAYRRAHVPIRIKPYPTSRRLAMARDGSLDALTAAVPITEMARSGPVDDLIQLPLPIAHEEVVVFSTRSLTFTVQGYDSLMPYSVGYVLGIPTLSARLAKLHTDTAVNNELLLKKLAHGRTQVAVDFRSTQCLVKELNLQNVQMLAPPLEVFDLYHYLHKRHAKLAVRIEKILAEMRADGTISRIHDSVKARYDKRCT